MTLNLNPIPIPERMRDLQVWNGFPVTYVTMVNDGVPDFRTIDFIKTERCMRWQKCGICGNEIDGWFAFIGGELAVQNRMFSDPPMHKECAYYAAQVCPFLAGTRRQYGAGESKTEQVGNVLIRVDQTRPRRLAVYQARSYELVKAPDGQLLCRPCKKPRKLDWNIMPPSRE